jgi:hypothetical protein
MTYLFVIFCVFVGFCFLGALFSILSAFGIDNRVTRFFTEGAGSTDILNQMEQNRMNRNIEESSKRMKGFVDHIYQNPDSYNRIFGPDKKP